MNVRFRFAPLLIPAPFADVEAQSDSTARDSARTLRPVTVVGSRAPRLVVDVPFAVTIVGRDAFEATRGYGMEDALANVPGVFAQTRSGSSDVRITIRGSGARRALLSLGLTAPLGERTMLGVQAIGTNNLVHVPGPLTRAQAEADSTQGNATYRQRDERRGNRLGRLALTLDHGRGSANGVSAMLFVSPKYLQRSERGTFRDFTRYHFGGNVIGHVGGALSETVRHTLTAGIDGAYQDGAIRFYSLTPEGTRGSELRDNKREGAQNLGAFVQEELWLGTRTLVSVGARWDDITYRNQSYIARALAGSKSFSRVTPKLGLTYHLGDDHTVYASVGGVVEAPAGNEIDPASTFGQDTVYALNPLLDPIRSASSASRTRSSARRSPSHRARGAAWAWSWACRAHRATTPTTRTA